MKLSLSSSVVMALVAVAAPGVSAFVPTLSTNTMSSRFSSMAVESTTTMAESGIPPSTAEPSMDMADEVLVPTNLPSDCGMDYIPLATMLATGQLTEADQVSFFFGGVIAVLSVFRRAIHCDVVLTQFFPSWWPFLFPSCPLSVSSYF